jgi:8-oxo-dGTP pyrophosphatase MutT (NUDIX family)
VQKALQESQSLKPHFDQIFDESYQTARRLAVIETGLDIAIFPEKSLFTPEQALDPDFLPET